MKPIDAGQFRRVLSHFASGITVVTSEFQGDRHGMTCTAFCSIAVTPPTILVSMTRGTRTEKLVRQSNAFAVNFLAADQVTHSDRFAGRHKDKEGDRFEGMPWKAQATGSPVFEGTLGWLDCRVQQLIEAHDHTLALGEVVAAHLSDALAPLLHYGSRYHRLGEGA